MPRLGICLIMLMLTTLAEAQTAPTSKPASSPDARRFQPEEGAKKLAEFSQLYHDLPGWQKRAELIRQGMLDGLQLNPMPKLAPLNIIRHSKRDLDGYSVENVAVESVPGIFVTGNLYIPAKLQGQAPAMLCVHGHGRRQGVRIAKYIQDRAATLARLGVIVFAYDMVGFGDGMEVSAHTLPLSQKLQTINSMRAVDFVLSLPQVDPKRVGITGESGGGSQTFILAAVDPRITLSVPVVMVSAWMPGGCVCESGMPIRNRSTHETNNAEIAALAAPRPMLIISDGKDWTRNTPTVEFPYIQNVYKLFGVADDVENAHFATEGHDYGPNKREAMYRFVAKHWKLDLNRILKDDKIDESPNKTLSPDDLRVFNSEHPRPANALMGDAAVMKALQ